MDGFLSLIQPVLALAFLAAVVVCFLKGRHVHGWIGVAWAVLGAGWFPLFRYLRERDALVRMWPVGLLGAAVTAYFVVAARRPALPGSVWDRRWATPR